MTTPNGIDEIISVFGDIDSFIDGTGALLPAWTEQYLTTIDMPFPLALSWSPTTFVSRMTCHKLLAATFAAVFQTIQGQGLTASVRAFGGCFSFRPQRTGARLSTHAWGIAIDLNPLSNEQGTTGDMDTRIISIFNNFGFSWGGNWPLPRKDPMHFQFATGY